MSVKQISERIIFTDFIRAFACLMVIMVHACEFFYVNGINTYFIKPGDEFWVSKIDGALRACVPLFVMVSAYLLLPLKDTPSVFYKKRITRVVIPFIIWSILYAILPYLWGDMSSQEVSDSLVRLLSNFNMSSGHLWFVYMLLGLYLFMPVISPWLQTVSKRFEEVFLLIWFFTTFYHYITQYVPDLFGECFWNEFSTIWYFSGYIGYLVLAHYIKKYINWSTKRSVIVGALLFIVGYIITFKVFDSRVGVATSAADLELSWRFCTFNVAMMATGLFLMFKAIKNCNKVLLKVVRDISKLSYGMYLVHIFVLNLVFTSISEYFTTPVTIVLVSIITYVLSYFVMKIISFVPKSKYLIG